MTNKMSEKKKIMVIIPPATGHVNPICGLIHELCKNKNIEVLFYNDERYQELIEKTGATFRRNEKLTYSTIKPEDFVNRKGFGYMFRKLIDFAYDLLPQYLADVEKEKPDLILYDGMSITTKYLIEILKVRAANGETKIQMPKTAEFAPNFPYSDAMLKKIREKNDEDIWSAFSLLGAFIKQFVFCWYYGISTYNPFKLFLSTNDKLVVVGVNPELQPDRDYFDNRFKFVGSCIAEEARTVDLKADLELNEFLAPFDRKPNDLKLIFMSLGSMYNASFTLYDKAIEAFKKYDENNFYNFKSSQLRIIISAGASLKKFNEKISSGQLVLPKNVLLKASVPQLEVLKRADLFITHCGMNSTLETIKFGVPVIGLPLDFDQPTNAARICDELSFGIRLNPKSFTPEQLAHSVDQVLSDVKFKTNIERMSEISAKYKGAADGTKILTDYLYE